MDLKHIVCSCKFASKALFCLSKYEYECETERQVPMTFLYGFQLEVSRIYCVDLLWKRQPFGKFPPAFPGTDFSDPTYKNLPPDGIIQTGSSHLLSALHLRAASFWNLVAGRQAQAPNL